MATLAAIERRLARLEARALASRPTSRRVSLSPLSPDAARAVLAMLIEMGVLTPPMAGAPDHFYDLRHALYEPGGQPAAHDAVGQ